jgi:hypothetical protein
MIITRNLTLNEKKNKGEQNEEKKNQQTVVIDKTHRCGP